MKIFKIKYKKGNWKGLEFGKGNKLLIAFPGFDDSPEKFKLLDPSLGKEYLCYVISLPFSNKEEWLTQDFDIDDLIFLVEHILSETNSSEFDMIGHSFGARVVQHLVFKYSNQINRIYLLAPDGLRTSIYNMELVPRWLKISITKLMKNPSAFNSLQDRLFKIGLLSRFNYFFLKKYINDDEKRRQLFGTWLSQDNFRSKPKLFRKYIKQADIRTFIFIGDQDEIIPLKAIENLSNGLSQVSYTILEKEDHWIVNSRLNKYLDMR